MISKLKKLQNGLNGWQKELDGHDISTEAYDSMCSMGREDYRYRGNQLVSRVKRLKNEIKKEEVFLEYEAIPIYNHFKEIKKFIKSLNDKLDVHLEVIDIQYYQGKLGFQINSECRGPYKDTTINRYLFDLNELKKTMVGYDVFIDHGSHLSYVIFSLKVKDI